MKITRVDQFAPRNRTRLIRMGSLVEEQVEFAIRSLLEGNQELAKIVSERDDKVDKLDLKIDKQCQRIFALNQPVASDLRLLLAAMKINNELERIGDMAAGISNLVLRSPASVKMGNAIEIERFTNAVHVLITSSIDAFINNDPTLATNLLPTDRSVNTIREEMQTALISAMEADTSQISAGAQLMVGLHNLGRMADHATNIGSHVSVSSSHRENGAPVLSGDSSVFLLIIFGSG